MLVLKKGDEVRVLDVPTVQEQWRGAWGTVKGFRPDGYVVIEFKTGMRKPFRRDEIEKADGGKTVSQAES
jgi:hypothetical protein